MSLAGAVAAAMAATASKLPSPLQVVVAGKPVSITLILGLFTLALLDATSADEELSTTWETLPPVFETFSSYEDMQRYFDHRNQRRLRHIKNPSKDSYIEAYNQHNEQQEERIKRSASEEQKLQIQPILYKFEMADAVEPSDEVKQLIRQYKSRELQQNSKYMETVPPSRIQSDKPVVKRNPTIDSGKQKAFGKRLNRNKRSAPPQQPANFKVKYIPFEVTDAREPDSHTRNLIKRMRALEMEKLSKELPMQQTKSSIVAKPIHLEDSTATTKKPFTKRPKFSKQRKNKRIRREAAAPHMIKFEISDAKDPDPSLKALINTQPARETKDLKFKSATSAANSADRVDTANSDQNTQAANKMFVYKEAPTKVKKSIAAIPRDVQNIISHLIKGGGGSGEGGAGGGKAYLKYIPAKQMDYNNLKASYPIVKRGAAIYGHGSGGAGVVGGGYGKYAQTVPLKLIYQPLVVGAVGGHGGGYEGGGGEGGGHHGGGGGAVAVPVKYIGIGGGAAGYGDDGSHSGGVYAAGGGHGAIAGHVGGGGGVAVKYVAAIGGEGAHGGNYEGGYGAGYGGAGGHEVGGGGGGGHIVGYAAAEEDGYSGEKGGVGGGGYVAAAAEEGYSAEDNGGLGSHSGGYAVGSGHAAGYGLVHGAGLAAHANYAGLGGEDGGGRAHVGGGGGAGDAHISAHAPVAIAHPIVVAEGGGGHQKGAGFGAGNAGNEAIKAIPAPQFKGETKYSVIPTVEQYAKTPTQDFHLKLYSPESLIAKAQLIAKDQAKAIAEEGQKAVAAAYSLAAAKGAAAFGGGYGGGKAGYGSAAEGVYEGAKGGAGYGTGGGGASAGPVIKIEYHAPAESLKGNYRDIPEFQQLSALVGKSPEDQIHGLTYLLAKEMQNRLHLQRQHNFGGGSGGGGLGKGAGGYDAGKVVAGGVAYGGGGEALATRPQDNKAPVQFQPQEAEALEVGKGGAAGGFYQPIVGKYIGMAKSKQYIPVIEQEELKGAVAEGAGGALLGGKGAAESGGLVGKLAGSAYGLSPNYKSLGGLKGFAGGLGAKEAVGGGESFHSNAYEEAAAKLQSYASKYAFGYRIRDFNTGNDFGHKQNRDLHGVTRGQYHILLPDGRVQNVIYHADDTGFHADVSFESGR